MGKKAKIILVILILVTQAQAQTNGGREITANYEESEVSDYVLPKVLEAVDGEIINNRTLWEKKRRPEILKLFENNVYGQMPEAYDGIKFNITNEVADAMYGEDYLKNGKAYLKEITITVWRMKDSVDINLTLFLPNHQKKPVPVFLLINNRDKYNTDPTRFIRSQFWPAEMVIDSGYAIAAFHVNDAAPDNKESYQEGVLELYPEQLGADNGMKAIGSWAWAASRVMDYFEKDTAINSEEVAIVGHSRGGKASLWAGAQDQRFALVFSNNSGNTGAALSRRMFGETIEAINNSFPYWFTDNYKKYNNDENALPIDQHMLISLIAPRPVYITTASEDLWSDPKGSYLSLLHAQEVYDLYGRKSVLSQNPPGVDMPIIKSFSGYHNREGAHNMTAYDWKNFIRFANHHFRNK